LLLWSRVSCAQLRPLLLLLTLAALLAALMCRPRQFAKVQEGIGLPGAQLLAQTVHVQLRHEVQPVVKLCHITGLSLQRQMCLVLSKLDIMVEAGKSV
jgi:hypothetical protein